MKIPTRLKPENESQKPYKLQWQGAFGKMILETFLTCGEAEKLSKAGVMCETL